MKFEKYHGLGNDFVIVDYKELDENENLEKLAVKICNRFTGIGSDGLVIAGTKTNPHQMTFIDPSGYRDKMCGNAIRCLSYFFKRQGYEKDQIEILTDDGLKIINIISKDPFVVEVNMQTFDWTPKNIPAISDLEKIFDVKHKLKSGFEFEYSAVNFGPAHVVIFVNELDDKIIYEVVDELNIPSLFPSDANFNFAKVIDENNIELKTWERGIGITLACGTGSCAVAALSNIKNLTKGAINIHQALGKLTIEKKGDSYFMQGPAQFVYSGEIDITKL